jgi:UDP-N-acetyl-D-mannosaminuronic acid dehydrogenase
MKFAIANEFFEIAHRGGLDYSRIPRSVRTEYPRAADLPGPRLCAGPRLLKDTMQLAAFSPDQFPIGRAAMLVNEGLPGYVVEVLNRRRPLVGRTVGILGMAFNGGSDDPRNSLSYKLKKLLGFKGAEMLCTDPYVRDPELLTLEQVVRQSDTVIVAAPHTIYREIALDGCEVVDIWDLRGEGVHL